MLDPSLTRGPDYEDHLVWSWGWRGQSLGYAHPPELVHSSEQREKPIMADHGRYPRGAKNTGAPEIIWDAAKSPWLIIQSSTVGKAGGQS